MALSAPLPGETAIFITPGYRFRAADVLMTNFHLPKSTLIMLVSAFAGHAATLSRLRPRGQRRLPVLLLRRLQPVVQERRSMTTFPFEIAATDGAARTGAF